MKSVKVSSKGRMIIPKAVREALDIRGGAELGVELLPGRAFKGTVKPTNYVEQARRLAGCLAQYGRGYSSAGGDDVAVLQAVAEDDARSRGYGKRARRKRP